LRWKAHPEEVRWLQILGDFPLLKGQLIVVKKVKKVLAGKRFKEGTINIVLSYIFVVPL